MAEKSGRVSPSAYTISLSVMLLFYSLAKHRHLSSPPLPRQENLSFFLEACKSLGLKGSQLFSPDDLITPSHRSPSYAAKA